MDGPVNQSNESFIDLLMVALVVVLSDEKMASKFVKASWS